MFELRLPVFPYANTVGTKKFSKCFTNIILSTATLHWSLWELFFPFKSPTSPSVWIWNVWPKRFLSWRAAFLRLPLEIKTYLEKIDKMLVFAIKSSNYRNWGKSILVFLARITVFYLSRIALELFPVVFVLNKTFVWYKFEEDDVCRGLSEKSAPQDMARTCSPQSE